MNAELTDATPVIQINVPSAKPRVVSITNAPRVISTRHLDDESERFIHDIFDPTIHNNGAQSKLVLEDTRVDATETTLHNPSTGLHDENGRSNRTPNEYANGHSNVYSPHANGHGGQPPAPGFLGRIAHKILGRRHVQ